MAEFKKSKCTKSEYARQWDGPRGTIFYFNVAFEDGTSGEYGCKDKNDPKIKVGEEVEYEVTEREYNGQVFKTIKKHYSQTNQGTFNTQSNAGGSKSNYDQEKQQKGIFACTGLKESINYHCAGGGIVDKETILETAKVFSDWLRLQAV